MGNLFQTGIDGYYHPADETEIKDLILYAKNEGKKIRVRGAAHSVKDSIYTKSENGINIMLDKLLAVNIDKKNMRVTAQAGCHLGRDPYDPSGTSNLINSLFYQLDQEGLAVPDMGGIIHQTVGGFISTGSAGGSVIHAFSDQIMALKLIDGNGETHILTRESGDDLFFAAGVSFGLFGIITEATFALVNKFNIKGSESTTSVVDCEVDLFGNGTNGKPGLQEFLVKTEYTRLMWWPQNGFERIVVWKANQIPSSNDFKPQPYLEFSLMWGTEIPEESAGGLYYSVVGNWKNLEDSSIPFYVKWIMKLAGWLYPKHILPKLLQLFVPLDPEKTPPGAQQFWDIWYRGLPMDNRVNDKLIPVEFTEIWIPIDKTALVMQKLRDYYAKTGYAASGSFSTEIYAAKKSDFWLSPSYNRDVIRVDLFWFKYNQGDPAKVFYPQFWDLLMNEKDFSCRFHWGKYMPINPDYLKKQYPKMNEFLSFRSKLDPSNIFLTQYWKDRLGI
ncbi:MAG: FAD-binding protein [Ignavibacteriales bacterium]|nr:FAD-binding protein [Ignavibacteriales bacterium]